MSRHAVRFLPIVMGMVVRAGGVPATAVPVRAGGCRTWSRPLSEPPVDGRPSPARSAPGRGV